MVGDLDKSNTPFYQGRPTTAARLVASVEVEIRTLLTDSTIERCACDFRAPSFVSPLSRSSHD